MNKSEIVSELHDVSQRVNRLEDAVKALPDEPVRLFERGDRVKSKAWLWEGDVIECGGTLIVVKKDDSEKVEGHIDDYVLVTPAPERKIEQRDIFTDNFDFDCIAASVENEYITDTNGNRHLIKYCTFRYRPKTSAHKWEKGQWAVVNDCRELSLDWLGKEVYIESVYNESAHISRDDYWQSITIKSLTPIPAPAFEVGQTVARKRDGEILNIINRHLVDGSSKWMYNGCFYESELTAQLPKFKVGDKVVHRLDSGHNIQKIIKMHYDNNTWIIDTDGMKGLWEKYLTLAPADDWKVGQMAIRWHAKDLSTVFKVGKITAEYLYDTYGHRHDIDECCPIVSMQIAGDAEIKPGRWVRTPEWWEGLVIYLRNSDGAWYVDDAMDTSKDRRYVYFQPSELTLLDRPPEVLR